VRLDDGQAMLFASRADNLRDVGGQPSLETRDYNGLGDWSLEVVRQRYRKHAEKLGLRIVTELVPLETSEGNVRWVYPVMDTVIKGIERGDAACVELGVEFLESSHRQPFGRILHSNAARALRRAALTHEQTARLRARILGMLVAGQVPHEFKQYAKLLRHIGLEPGWKAAREQADHANPYVMKYVRYLDAWSRKDSPGP
jgi:hypothetical protein